MDSLPEPLLHAIADCLSSFDGLFRRRCDAAADAARLALVGSTACTQIARKIWAAIDPGCEAEVRDAEAQRGASASPQPIVGPSPDVGPESSLAVLRSTSELVGSRRRSGSRAQIWSGICRRMAELEREAADRSAKLTELISRADRLRHCWVRTTARRQIQEESRRVMDAAAIQRSYDLREDALETIPRVTIQRGSAVLRRKASLWRVTDIVHSLIRAHGTSDSARLAVTRDKQLREERTLVAHALMERLPASIRNTSPLWGLFWAYVNRGAQDSRERLETSVDAAVRRIRDVRSELGSRGVDADTFSSWPPFFQFVFYGQGSAAQVAERWFEIAFLTEHTNMRVPLWEARDLLRVRAEDVWTRLCAWCVSLSEERRHPPQRVPRRFETFVRDAILWTSADAHAHYRAVLATDLLGGPHTTLGRSFTEFVKAEPTSPVRAQVTIETVRAKVAWWFGEGAWPDVRQAMDAWQIAALVRPEPKPRSEVSAAILAALCGHRVARWLPTLSRGGLVPTHADEVLRLAWSGAHGAPVAHALARIDLAARRTREAVSRRRWNLLVKDAAWGELIRPSALACTECRARFETDEELDAHGASHVEKKEA